MKRLLQIGFIWLGCAIAWVVLGSTLVERSGETSSALLDEVYGLWGPPLELRPPTGTYIVKEKKKQKTTVRDAGTGRETETEIEHEEDVPHDIRLDGSDLHATLHLVQRQKGLLWFPTYDVELNGRYRLVNDSGEMRRIDFAFPLPGDHAVYDAFSVLDERGEQLEVSVNRRTATWSAILKDGEARTYHVALRSRGTSRFGYALGDTGEVRDFNLVVDTDFTGVDFPSGSLSPTTHHLHDGGWRGEWKSERLIAAQSIAIDLPQRVNPGPLASRITFFAPVGLLFFFFVVAVRAAATKQNIHPLNYFFFGCAFFAFHLLFAYLVDHVAIFPALAISSVTSIFLVVSYARLFVTPRFAFVDMAISQLLYLVLFSATFLWKGYTGLAITVGAVVTLFVMMQFTGRRAPEQMLAVSDKSA